MSEKVYSWLLRLLPSDFRERFGEEAIQLFRDRFREEKGFWLRFRLWADLIFDLAVCLPREHVRARSKVAGVSPIGVNRSPSFQIQPDRPTRFVALFLGGAISLAALCIFSLSVVYVARHPAAAPGAFRRGFNSRVPSSDEQAQAQMTDTSRLDTEERQRVIEAAALNLRKHYVDYEMGQRVADSLLGQERNGGYDGISDKSTFADLLTNQMRSMSYDMELAVVYSDHDLPVRGGGPTAQRLGGYKRAMEQSNCTFEKVEILSGNIGYLKLNSFPDTSVCRTKAVSAMATFNHAKAIIFDLRDNRGGYPEMTSLIASYLFDRPEHWFNPRENAAHQSLTSSPVPGNRLADKPVYILSSRVTASGAEQFTYNLKMLKRATVVGERTAGAEHAGVFFRINDHFGIAIPEVRPINPHSNSGWSVVGVEPDVKTDSGDALTAAENLARAGLPRAKGIAGK